MYQGLPGGVCSCPHDGYVFSGRLRVTYPGSDRADEVATAGDVYYFPAGHILVYEEDSEMPELNPAAALVDLMDHIHGLQESARLDGLVERTESSGG